MSRRARGLGFTLRLRLRVFPRPPTSWVPGLGHEQACQRQAVLIQSQNEKMRRTQKGTTHFYARGLGFEPRLAESESAVLPLNDPRKKAEGDNEHTFNRLSIHKSLNAVRYLQRPA